MTLTNIIARVLSKLGRAGDTTLNNDITYALEQVQDDITSDIPFVELMQFDTTSLNLTSDTQTYDLPDDFGNALILWNNDDFEQELIRLKPIEYTQYWSDIVDQTGTNPIYYDILGSAASGSTYRKRIKFFPYKTGILNGIIASFANLAGVPATFTNYNSTVSGAVQITDVAHGLETGMSVVIAGTVNYNGTFEVTRIDADNFYIFATYVAEAGGGTWTATGTQVTDIDHGLSTGDSITISGTTNYNGAYTVIVISTSVFYINATYVAEAGSNTTVWSKNHYIPMVYMKTLAYLSATNTENVLSYVYPQLYIEGATYYMYRDVIYRDQPEKIAFRRQEYERVKNQVLKDNIQTDRISQVVPRRYLGNVRGRTQLFRTQYNNYTS